MRDISRDPLDILLEKFASRGVPGFRSGPGRQAGATGEMISRLLLMVMTTLTVGLVTPASLAQGRTAADVIAAFQEAGFPIGEVTIYDEDTDRLFGRPGGYIEKISWWDTRVRRGDEITISSGGSLERFASDADYRARVDYLEAVATGPLFGEYRFLSPSERIILRIALDLTPTAANDYGTTFLGG